MTPGLALAVGALLAFASGAPACATQRTEPAGVEWLLLDADADPGGLGGRPGALFAADLGRGTLRLVATSAEWRDPIDLLVEDERHALVLDYRDGPEPDGRDVGAIFRVDLVTGSVERVGVPGGLVDPVSFARDPDGSLWIADKSANPRKLSAKTGALFHLSADRRRLGIVATGPPLVAPADVRRGPDGAWYLLDADAKPGGAGKDEGTIFRVDAARGDPLFCAVPAGTLSPLSLVPEPDGAFLVVDANADPADPAKLRGAVFRVDPKGGTTAIVAACDAFRDPLRGERDGDDLLVVDANADPGGFGPDGLDRGFGGDGRGAVFRVDLRTGACRAILVSKELATPTALRAVPARRR